MKINANINKVKTSATLEINEKSKFLEKKGKQIYKFGLGQSPFPVPKNIVTELKKNSHQKDYLNVSGLEDLRVAVSKYHSKKNKFNYLENNVMIGPGSKELIFQTQLVLNSDLLLPAPSWVSYEPQAKILNKKTIWIQTYKKNKWHLTGNDLEKICKKSKKNKLLILNSPNNPSGTSNEYLKQIAKIAKKYKVIIIADEIYAELDFSGSYKSITHYYPEGTIISSGLSKWCGAGGWRIGTMIFPQNLSYIKDAIRIVASETFTSVSAPIQFAAIKAYSKNHQNYLNKSRKILKFISEYIFSEFTSNSIECVQPDGGFYMLCSFSKIKKIKQYKFKNSQEMCKTILSETGFAMLPGSDFGFKKNKLISRIAFVDFDGSKALKEFSSVKKFNNNTVMKNIFPNIFNGVNSLLNWLKIKT
ncbi:MAG: aminotransferase class I/II-fold pyridoxal phosphate-dependent enzyme [Pelagibacteraceae bacterium]|nr:aminotransferase class I/II-fold pyridoxal phosphate-dependent enzyme [Pelagibacteraceae bacterium]MBT4645821.1 aminotransferase class I/II-fold pyridoxal phosphate-dependent enzyme [Pelagibacteraceae bacterium]